MCTGQYKRKDHYYKLAKKMGFRSRAAFKLIQINKKFRVIRKGDIVVDLGAAPGGWSQVALEAVGEEGFVLAVDIKPLDIFKQNNFAFLKKDIFDEDIQQEIMDLLPRKPNVVLSDVSPNISGIWEIDHAKQISMAERTFEIAKEILRGNGGFLVKVFQGRETSDFYTKLKESFKFVKRYKPQATRTRSSEIYIVATKLKGVINRG